MSDAPTPPPTPKKSPKLSRNQILIVVGAGLVIGFAWRRFGSRSTPAVETASHDPATGGVATDYPQADRRELFGQEIPIPVSEWITQGADGKRYIVDSNGNIRPMDETVSTGVGNNQPYEAGDPRLYGGVDPQAIENIQPISNTMPLGAGEGST